MRHGAHIVRVIAAHMVEIIAERLTLCEMLAEIGKAAIQRMTAGVDYFGIGQDQADKTQIGPVVWQLIDKEGFRRLALDTCPLDIFSAQGGKPFRRHVRHRNKPG